MMSDRDDDESSPMFQQAMEESLMLHRQQVQEQQRREMEEERMIQFLQEQQQAEERLKKEREEEEKKRRELEEQQQKQREEQRRGREKEKEEEQRVIQESIDTHHEHIRRHEMNDYANNYITSRTERRIEGSWDCPACTLVNEPYASNCKACEESAPCTVLSYRPFPHNLPFGLEIEIIVPNGRKDGFTYESIARDLTRLSPHEVTYEGYSHQTMEHWKIVTDSSIHPSRPGHDLCFELVSPILIGESGLTQLRNIMDSLLRIGIESNKSCGFHVHVDAEHREGQSGTLSSSTMSFSTVRQIRRIARAFVAVENAFDLIVGSGGGGEHSTNPSRPSSSRGGGRGRDGRRTNTNRFCKSNRIAFGLMSNRQRWNTISDTRTKQHIVDLMNPNNDRYRKLNLTNITRVDRPSTIEFRHHAGVEDLPEAEAWVRLVLAFCENAAAMPSENTEGRLLLPESSPVDEEVCALFRLVNCRGLEQMYTLDRRLFIRENLKNEWKCKTCRRRFGESRSLAQHCSATGHQM